jgi:hypothetical protein
MIQCFFGDQKPSLSPFNSKEATSRGCEQL